MTEPPSPRERTEKLIAFADEVANRPLPLQTRILLPAILAIVGVGAFWFGFRDNSGGPGPGSPTAPTTVAETASSVVLTAPP